MPYNDGTGPSGRGPVTGRGFGPCEGDRQNSGFLGFGRGFGFGRSFGRRSAGRRGYGLGLGWRLNPWANRNSNPKESLKQYRQNLEKELEDVKKQEQDLK